VVLRSLCPDRHLINRCRGSRFLSLESFGSASIRSARSVYIGHDDINIHILAENSWFIRYILLCGEKVIVMVFLRVALAVLSFNHCRFLFIRRLVAYYLRAFHIILSFNDGVILLSSWWLKNRVGFFRFMERSCRVGYSLGEWLVFLRRIDHCSTCGYHCIDVLRLGSD
jgi:hypothetical protein